MYRGSVGVSLPFAVDNASGDLGAHRHTHSGFLGKLCRRFPALCGKSVCPLEENAGKVDDIVLPSRA